MTIQFPLHSALAARDALAAQTDLMRVRATVDRRWQPEVARLEAAHGALTRLLDAALAATGDSAR